MRARRRPGKPSAWRPPRGGHRVAATAPTGPVRSVTLPFCLPEPTLKDLRESRREYAAHWLRRSNLADDPLMQFQRWFAEAVDAGIKDATAMALATADTAGAPSVRERAHDSSSAGAHRRIARIVVFG